MPRAKKTAKPAKTKRSGWQRFVRGLLLTLTVLAVIALMLTGYAGCVSPLKHSPVWGIFPLCFPFAFWAVIIMLVLDLFWYRPGSIIVAAGLLACGGPVLDYFPLNIVKPKAGKDTEKFTLLTYNVLNFWPRDSSYTRNRALDYILEQDADLVCLQESAMLVISAQTRTTQAQIDSVHARYPHIVFSGTTQAIFSKFPVESIHLDVTRETFSGGDAAAYRITLPSGRLMSIFNVHMQSFLLNDSDKQLYMNLTDLRREPLHDVKSQLFDKLENAVVSRAKGTQQLMRWIRLYGGPDAIVCGDFNDVSSCYAIRTLADMGFREVYPRVGFGPMITYNDDRFYFGIDHVLSRGDLRPLALSKGRLKASDHYPLKVTFEIEK